MPPIIVLIRGYSQSGKDFVGRTLCQRYEFQRFAFADSLKRIVASLYQCPIEILHSQQGKQLVCQTDPHQRTYRQILIDEALRLRAMDDTLFIKECCQDMKKQGASRMVITDWRYPIEYTMLCTLFPDATIVPLHVIRKDRTDSPVDDISEHFLANRLGDYQLINTMDASVEQDIHRFVKTVQEHFMVPIIGRVDIDCHET